MQLGCWSLAHFSMNSCVRLGASPTVATTVVHSQSESQFLLRPAPLAQSAALPRVLTGLVVLVDFFFNSLADGVPCSLIFWHFWLFLDFKLVIILLLVVRGSEGFLPVPLSWLEPTCFCFFRFSFDSCEFVVMLLFIVLIYGSEYEGGV